MARPVKRAALARWLRPHADAAWLTGLLDITGGPFNRFIVMFVVYVWLVAGALSTRWSALAGIVSAVDLLAGRRPLAGGASRAPSIAYRLEIRHIDRILY